jgi:hypothetical protein
MQREKPASHGPNGSAPHQGNGAGTVAFGTLSGRRVASSHFVAVTRPQASG